MPDDLIRGLAELVEVVGRSDTEGLRGEVHAEREERRSQTSRIVKWVAWGMALVVLVGVVTITGAYWLIVQNRTRIGQSVRADCQFYLDIVHLPGLSPNRPSPNLVTLAVDARDAFVTKGCPSAVNPRSGRPFGPPPEVRTR